VYDGRAPAADDAATKRNTRPCGQASIQSMKELLGRQLSTATMNESIFDSPVFVLHPVQPESKML
jgi:hypothetical protein